MRKIRLIIYFIIIHATIILSQSINQKLLVTIPKEYGKAESYSLKYDRNTGSWIYVIYDQATNNNYFLTPKGISEKITYGFSYNSLFDSRGNSYSYGYDVKNDTIYEYKLFKNNEHLINLEFINDGWNIKNDILYFAAKEGGKHYLFSFDTKDQTISKGKGYDEIYFINIPKIEFEGEPQGTIGFTSTGLPYYLASENNEWFIVIGEKEHKRYSDISRYEFILTSKDEPCYIAKTAGKFFDTKGNTILVKGDKEFRSFDWIYGPLLIDNSDKIYYVGQDSLKDYTNLSRLMKDDEELVSLQGNIYSVNFTPQGKLSYNISKETINKKGEISWINYLVIENRNFKAYNSVYSPKFNNKGDVLYIASDSKNKSFVILNDEIISEKFDFINQADFLADGGIGYSAINYGNYEQGKTDKNFIFINNKKFGPYDVVIINNWKIGKIILTDTEGNYAFTSGKLIDKENYFFKYTVISNKGKSKEYDIISETQLINGKLVYIGGNLKDKDNYIYEYNFFVDNKKIDESYTSYSEYSIDSKGVVSFTATKGNNIYFIEIKL